LPFGFVQCSRNRPFALKRVDGTIDDTVEFIFDRQRIVQLSAYLIDLMKKFDHHRNLHGACGVKKRLRP